MKILHVISYPRSGSTILGLAFGQYKEATYLGEVSALFTHPWSRPCGCSSHKSVHVFDCPVWGPILEKSQAIMEKFDFWDNENPGLKKDLRPTFLKMAFKQQKKGQAGPELKAIQEVIKVVFHEASKLENAEVVVDSSKNLDYFQIVQDCFGKDHFPLHLLRDSRGVVYSGRKNPSVPGKATPLSLWRSSRIALGWGAKNLVIENIVNKGTGSSLKLLYEDWCASPKTISDHIISQITKAQPEVSPFIDESTFNVEPSHSFFGNRSRKSTGTIKIKSDQSWRNKMEKKYRISSTLASAVFLKKYGYEITN